MSSQGEPDEDFRSVAGVSKNELDDFLELWKVFFSEWGNHF